MSEPVLSVCIPTRNRGDILVARVAEWLRRAPDGLEIVISDNASDDGTAEKLSALADDGRLVVVAGSEDVGSFENQLRAFEAAHGRYVMQLTDKDEILPSGMAAARDALVRTDAACGEFRLNCGDGDAVGDPVMLSGGLRAFLRHGFTYAHPSGRFFRRALVAPAGLSDKLRSMDEVIRPFSTDYLVSLCLRHGRYADIAVPFVRHNLPPYEGLSRSLSYGVSRTCYFTPEFVLREFEAYLGFLRRESGLGVLARMRLVAGLVKRVLFPHMTEVYRWCLGNAAIREWYGVSPEQAEAGSGRDLETEFFRAVRDVRVPGLSEKLGLVIGACACRRRAGRQRRRYGK